MNVSGSSSPPPPPRPTGSSKNIGPGGKRKQKLKHVGQSTEQPKSLDPKGIGSSTLTHSRKDTISAHLTHKKLATPSTHSLTSRGSSTLNALSTFDQLELDVSTTGTYKSSLVRPKSLISQSSKAPSSSLVNKARKAFVASELTKTNQHIQKIDLDIMNNSALLKEKENELLGYSIDAKMAKINQKPLLEKEAKLLFQFTNEEIKEIRQNMQKMKTERYKLLGAV